MENESNEPSALQKMLESAYKPREPIPYSPPPFAQATPEHYAESLRPRDLLARFPISNELAVRQLRRELEYDRAQAIAHEGIWRLGDEQGRTPNLIVGSWMWQLTMPGVESDFWDTGYLEVWVPHTIHEYRVELSGVVRLYGVRFWPDGDALLALPPPQTDGAAPTEAKPPVSDADISRWFEVFSQIHQGSTEDFALRSAQSMFPDNYVSRQRVRDLRGPQKRGRPTKR